VKSQQEANEIVRAASQRAGVPNSTEAFNTVVAALLWAIADYAYIHYFLQP
jgi:hypothetical protein